MTDTEKRLVNEFEQDAKALPRLKPPTLYAGRSLRGVSRDLNTTNNELGRFLRALERLHVWECHACQEIFTQGDPSFFGVCRDCWLENDTLDEILDFRHVVPQDVIHTMWRPWYDACQYDHLFGQAGNKIRGISGTWSGPVEHEYLLSLITWIGWEQLREWIARHDYHRPKAVINSLDISYYPDRGWLPLGPGPFPPREDAKALRSLFQTLLQPVPPLT